MMFRRPRPTMALMVRARRMKGKESCTSHRRMSALPGQPPKKPEETEKTAHEGGEEHGAEADEEGHPRPIQYARQGVASELVRAQRVPRGARGLEALGEITLHGVVGREHGR